METFVIIVICLLVVGMIVLMTYGLAENNKDYMGGLLAILFFLVVFCMIEGGIISKSMHYKEGQIDALNGKVLYELKENADHTKTWQLKK